MYKAYYIIETQYFKNAVNSSDRIEMFTPETTIGILYYILIGNSR